jgi:hypothetical protein
MILPNLFFAVAAGTLQTSATVESLDQLSKNVVLGNERAIVSLSCDRGSVSFRLRWPTRIEAPFLNIGVGNSNGMDAAMGAAEPWKIVDSPDRRTAMAPLPAAKIVASSAGEELLLLNVRGESDSTIAEFDALLMKAALDELVGQCSPA